MSQKGLTIAVNYWHDMQFDHKYVYYRFLQGLATARNDERLRRLSSDDDGADRGVEPDPSAARAAATEDGGGGER